MCSVPRCARKCTGTFIKHAGAIWQKHNEKENLDCYSSNNDCYKNKPPRLTPLRTRERRNLLYRSAKLYNKTGPRTIENAFGLRQKTFRDQVHTPAYYMTSEVTDKPTIFTDARHRKGKKTSCEHNPRALHTLRGESSLRAPQLHIAANRGLCSGAQAKQGRRTRESDKRLGDTTLCPAGHRHGYRPRSHQPRGSPHERSSKRPVLLFGKSTNTAKRASLATPPKTKARNPGSVGRSRLATLAISATAISPYSASLVDKHNHHRSPCLEPRSRPPTRYIPTDTPACPVFETVCSRWGHRRIEGMPPR